MTLKPVEVWVPITELHYVGWEKIKTNGHRQQTRTDVITQSPIKNPAYSYLRIDTRLLMRDLLMSHLSFFEMGYHEDLLDQIVRLTVDHQERKRLFCFCSGKLNIQIFFKNVSFFILEIGKFRQLTAELRCCWLDSGWCWALPPWWQNNKS